MTVTGFALVLAAALCHAAWNVCVKRVGGGAELIWLFSAVSAALFLPVTLWVIVTERPVLEPVHWLFLTGSAALHLAYFWLLQTGYRHGDLSLVYPTARATGPLLSASFAVLVLGETVTPQMGLGAALIIGGVLMLTGGIRRRAKGLAVSLGFGLAVGALIGTYTVWDAYAVAVLLISPILMDYATAILRTVALAPVAWRRREVVAGHWRNHRPEVFAIAILSPVAYILVMYALTFTPVAYVAPTREISVVLAVLAGSLLLGEGDLRRRLTWAGVIFAGMALLVTG